MKVRYIAFLLLVSMIASLTACTSITETADDEVREFTAEVCDSVIAADYDFFEENSVLDEKKDRDVEDQLDVFYDNDMWDKSQKKISDYIRSTLTYEIDYNSAFASHARKEGEIDVYFKHVDYLGLFKSGKAENAKEYYKLLKDYDQTVETKVHITFVMERRHWELADYEKIFVDLFTWKDFHYDFCVDYSNFIKKTSWAHDYDSGSGNQFENVIYIEFDVKTDGKDLAKDCYYEVFFNDDQEPLYQGEFVDDTFYGDTYYALYNGYLLNNGEYLDSGTYTFVCYDFNDNEFWRESCDVTKSSSSSSGSGSGSSMSSNNIVFGDSEFYDYYISSGWYITNSDFIEYDLWFDLPSNKNYDVYFELYNTDGELVYTSDMFEAKSTSSYVELTVEAADTSVDSLSVVECIIVYDSAGNMILSDFK